MLSKQWLKAQENISEWLQFGHSMVILKSLISVSKLALNQKWWAGVGRVAYSRITRKDCRYLWVFLLICQEEFALSNVCLCTGELLRVLSRSRSGPRFGRENKGVKPWDRSGIIINREEQGTANWQTNVGWECNQCFTWTQSQQKCFHRAEAVNPSEPGCVRVVLQKFRATRAPQRVSLHLSAENTR